MDSSEPTLNSGDLTEHDPATAVPAEASATVEKVKKPDPWVRRNFSPPPPLAGGIFTRKPWFGFLLPFIVYMVAGMFEPSPPKTDKPAQATGESKASSKDESESKTPVDKSAGESLDEFAEPETVESEPADVEKPADAHAAHGGDAESAKKEETEKGWFDGWFDWMNLPRLLGITYSQYPLVYTIKIALTIAAMAFVFPVYRTFFPIRVGALAIGVGVMGIGIWVGLWKFQAGANMLEGLGLGDMGARSAFNPWVQIENPLMRYGFLFVRFLGLVAIVPIMEEFFLRGFLVRYLVRDDRFYEVPFGYADDFTFGMATVVPMLMHPAELLPAAVWFTLVSWLMVRTRNIWDCIAAHAVTNLLLGVYVVISGEWELM